MVARRGFSLVAHKKEWQEGLVKRQRRSSEGWFLPVPVRQKGAGKDFPKIKGRGKDQKGKAKGTLPQSGLSASESDDWSASHRTDDSWAPDAAWFCTEAHTAWMVATPLNLASHPTHVVLDLGCTRSIGSKSAIERFKKHAWYYGITTKFCRCNVFRVRELGYRNLHGELHYPLSKNTTIHVLLRLMCFRQVMCPSCFPSLR